MTRPILGFSLLLMLFRVSAVQAQGAQCPQHEIDSPYDAATLAYWKTRYEPNIRANLDSVIAPVLMAGERARLASYVLELPLTGRDEPFSYYTTTGAGPRAISLSVASIKFMDDVALAAAWLVRHGYSTETIAYYSAVLKCRLPDDFPGRHYPLPLAALGIPGDALRDPVVDDVAQKILKGAITFVLAHEVGHAVLGHPASGSARLSQVRESQADSFAIAVFRRVGVPPAGLETFFLAATHMALNRGDFLSDAAWTRYVEQDATHPLTGRRLRMLASAMRASPADFTRRERDPAAALNNLRYMADQLDGLAPLLDDPLLQRHTTLIGSQIPLAELAPRRPGNSWLPGGPR